MGDKDRDVAKNCDKDRNISPSPSSSSDSSDPSDPSSKFSSSLSAIGNLLSNKAKFLGDQSSLLGHQMEMLEKELSDRLAGLEEQFETKKEEEHELRERLQGLKIGRQEGGEGGAQKEASRIE